MGEFALILEMFLEAIFKCVEERRRQDVEDGLNSPSGREYRVILRGLRKKFDLHGHKLRAEADEWFAMLCEMDAEDVSCLLDDAERRAA